MSMQAPSSVILIRPRRFRPNPETAVDNTFQTIAPTADPDEVARRARDEVTAVADALEAAGVTVHLFDDDDPTRPDSVFPNNWLSTHADGSVAVYPLFAPSRRGERRTDVLDLLRERYDVQRVVDYSSLEDDGLFLEGTGAMVLDHDRRVAYVSLSHRADPEALQRFCGDFGYEPVVFEAVDEHGIAIYHTNVMMCVASRFALVGLDRIRDHARRREVAARLADGGRAVIPLSAPQIRDFAANALEVQGRSGPLLAMSQRAHRSLSSAQLATIEESCQVLSLPLPTVELAGGSMRCMIAGVHLEPRRDAEVYAGVSTSSRTMLSS
ncbi:citrulline utilization hydrolase CtlX [Microbacterium sp. p3-SID336]|uniref:citrulline utilization hydrolase CtlX n=1 Tax=Microbacterium sp. p3-SID336 TaxID=2916212 RepID=UPI0021A8F937|nr:arginine deiminase-related protein [Microbacterium sp. p3-SID336]MCT1480013.1 arginine deiminase-related protein [Microbacterium sp. p3-SID336]